MQSVISFLIQNSLFRNHAPALKIQVVDYWHTQPIDVIVHGATPWFMGATAPCIEAAMGSSPV
jgi:hypothetical protein